MIGRAANRRAIFAELIGKLDRGSRAAASRALMSKIHQLDHAVVRAIEDEGLANEGPPLGE